MAKSLNPAHKIYTLPNAHKDAARFKWEGLILGLLIITLMSFITTQYLAYKLGYQPALGKPLVQLRHTPFYQPFSWVIWGWRYAELEVPYVRQVFKNAYIFITWTSSLGVISSFYLAHRHRRKVGKESEHLYGSARWPNPKEVKATGLLDVGEGVYIGGYVHPATQVLHYLRHNGPEHIMAFAPTRSGKGVTFILLTLLSWLESLLVYDIKGELWALTAGWRKTAAKNHALKFEPTAMDDSTIKINPLSEIRLKTAREVADTQNIAMMIVDPDGKGLNDHWAKTSYSLLVGVILHVLYAEPDKTLAGVANFLSDPARPLEETFHYMLNTEHDPDGEMGWLDNMGNPTKLHPAVAASARDMLNKSENEMSGVHSTAMSFLTLYRDPIIAKNTAHSEIKIIDLMNADKPVSLYLVVPPSDKDRLKPLIRLIINQVVRGLTEKMEFKEGRSVAGYNYRLLLMIDEFPSLGRLKIFEESLAFIAGYGLKAFLVVQDVVQLWEAYGKEESIFSNCHIRIAFAPNKIETAELLSKMTGVTTIVKDNASYSGNRLAPTLSSMSISQQEIERPLLTPDEVMRLPSAKKDVRGNITEAGDMLIFVSGHLPIYGKQPLYFMDPIFLERAKVPPPEKSDCLHVAPPVVKRSMPVGPEQSPEETQPMSPIPPHLNKSQELPPSDLSEIVGTKADTVEIEYAPAELANGYPEAIEQKQQLDQHVPLENRDDEQPLDEVLPPNEDNAKVEVPRDAILADMQALSEQSDTDYLGLFDDVLENEIQEQPKIEQKHMKNTKKIDDLFASMADILDEVAAETTKLKNKTNSKKKVDNHE